MSFGKQLREMRIEAGYSARGFAKMLGLSATYISKIERDVLKPPSAETIIEIAKVFGFDGDKWALENGKIPLWIQQLLRDKPKDALEVLNKLASQGDKE